jgi:ribonuclease HI
MNFDALHSSRPLVKIYTDGACAGNPGPGGWGALLVCRGQKKELCGGAPETTNNRMELTAALKGMQVLKKPCIVHIFTDSQYLKKGMTLWLESWQRNNWKTASGSLVKNKDLWCELQDALAAHTLSWHWVRGHSGHAENEIAHQLAQKGLTDFKLERERK